MSSGLFGEVWVSVCPGGVLVVEGSVLDAAVEDADEPVAERAESLVVKVASDASLVVEGSAACTAGEGAERPLIDRVVEVLFKMVDE